MGVPGAMNRKLKKPINKGTPFKVYETDSVGELMDARRGYVARTGRNDLKAVEQTNYFKKLTEKKKKKYYELNPSERPNVDENFTLGKKTLLGD